MAEQIDVSARLSSAADRAEQAADILHAVANGGPADEVSTNNGPLPSIAKWMADHEGPFAALVDAAMEPIQVQTGIAVAAAEAAESEADRAWAAADSAAVAGDIYPDVAAGLAATPVDGYFSVPSASAAEHLILYQNQAGAAAQIKIYPSADAVVQGAAAAADSAAEASAVLGDTKNALISLASDLVRTQTLIVNNHAFS